MKINNKQQRIVTLSWLETHSACEEGTAWFKKQKSNSLSTIINKLIKEKQFDWANWTITRFMSHQQNVQYACFCAYQSVEHFEKLYPNDKRPCLALEAALRWASNPTEENRSAVWSAESAAWSAVWSAESAAWKKLLTYGLNLVLGKVVDKLSPCV